MSGLLSIPKASTVTSTAVREGCYNSSVGQFFGSSWRSAARFVSSSALNFLRYNSSTKSDDPMIMAPPINPSIPEVIVESRMASNPIGTVAMPTRTAFRCSSMS